MNKPQWLERFIGANIVVAIPYLLFDIAMLVRFVVTGHISANTLLICLSGFIGACALIWAQKIAQSDMPHWRSVAQLQWLGVAVQGWFLVLTLQDMFLRQSVLLWLQVVAISTLSTFAVLVEIEARKQFRPVRV
jgi:hypothetical protein